MNLTQKAHFKFSDANHFVCTIKDLIEMKVLDADRLSEEIFSDYHWRDESKITVIEKLRNNLNFKLLSKNKNILWNYELLEKYKDEIDWDVKELYHTMTANNEITQQFIEHFRFYLNWELLGRYGLVRRDASLDILTAYKDKWRYKPNIDDSDLDVDPDFGIQGSYISKRDTIFNNKHIPWHTSEYKDAFKIEIDIYIDTLKKYFSYYLNLEAGNTTEFALEYKEDVRMFNADQMDHFNFK